MQPKLEDKRVNDLLIALRKSNNYADFALVPNPTHFRRVIKLVFVRLGVDALKLQLYGVRRGAATKGAGHRRRA